MCATCDAVGDAVLSELEREVILAEAEAGLGDATAHRPLSEAEKRAQVRFGEIAGLEDDYLQTVTPILAGLRETVDAEILAALAGAVTATALVDALEALTVAQPPVVREAAQEAAEGIARALEATYTASSRVAIGEAARQGVRRLPEPLAPSPAAFQAAAHRAALEPWAKGLAVAQREITNPQALAGEVLTDQDFIPAALARYDQAGAIDTARQFGHGAIGGGRNDTLQVMPQAAYYYSSELLDGRGCGPCSRIDGAEWTSLTEALQFYGSGTYRSCEGGMRCRGCLIAVHYP